MANKKSLTSDSLDSMPLRKQAEELLRERGTDISKMPPEDLQVLVHELQLHQIELELYNEELREAQVELAQSRDQFADLYEFAPTGYVTLDVDGKILSANMTVSTMLGVERQHLLQANLSRFVDRECSDAFYLHRQAVFSSLTKQTCELEMRKADGTALIARLESIAVDANTDRHCRTTLIDLTAERRVQRQLHESEQRFRRLTKALTDYTYHVRVENGKAVETVHGANCEFVTGYTPAEFADNSMLWIAMVPVEDRPAVKRQAGSVLSGQDVPPIEHRIQCKDGQIRWVLNTVSLQHDDQGRLIAYDGLLRDITKRKQAEESLQQLNETLELRLQDQTREIRLLAEAVAHLGEGVLITDDELDWPGPSIVFVNQALCRITGYTADELIGQSPRMLQGEETQRGTLDRLKAELSDGRPCSIEVTNYRKDGTRYDAELFITPLFDTDGRRTNFVSIHRDISKRKRAEQDLHDREERLRAVLNTASDAIITIDSRGMITGINPATESMFGYGEAELIGQNVNILMPAPYRDEHDDYIARYLKTGEARIIGIGREVVGKHKDGSTFPVGLAVSEVDHLGLFTGIVRDISAVKELQKQVLEIAADENRRIGQDLHDSIQQQLTGLGLLAKTVAERVARSATETDGVKTAEMASRVADGIGKTAHEVHLLSRGLVPVEVDAEGLRAALADLAASVDEQYGVQCEFQSTGAIEISDNFVATHLYRIAQEAVTNAIKHGHASRIDISLAGTTDDITLTVIDNGVGIGHKHHLGPGMGLRIMHYRAGLIGATVRMAPRAQGGTAVSCTIVSERSSLR